MRPSPLILTVLPWLALAFAAGAHPNPQNAMWVQFEPAQIRLALDVSLQELAAAWGIPPQEDAHSDPTPFLKGAQQHKAYILEHLSISVGTDRLQGEVVKVSPPTKLGDPERTFFQYELEYPLPGAPPKAVWVYHDMLKEWPYAPDTAWDVHYIVRTKRTGSDTMNSWLLRPGKPMELTTGWPEESQAPPKGPVEIQPQPKSSLFKNVLRDALRLLGL